MVINFHLHPCYIKLFYHHIITAFTSIATYITTQTMTDILYLDDSEMSSYSYEDFLSTAQPIEKDDYVPPPSSTRWISDGSSSTANISIDCSLRSDNCITSDRYTDIFSTYNVSSVILGTGNYGSVRECTHRVTGVRYAVKTINKSKISRHDHIQREVDLLRSVDHPNIMKMVDCFEDIDYVHIVTEMCTGGELFDKIVDNTTDYGCLPEHEAKSIIKSLLQSVQYLHSKDIVHRDIKPENLLFTSDDKKAVVKLIDFGLSRKHGINDGYMTNQVGTPYYMSQDILNGRYDRSCDLWSVGVVAYILLCGYPPFNGNNDNEVHESTQRGHVVFERCVWRNYSAASRDFVKQLLNSDLSTRIGSATEALKHPWLN